MAVYMTDSAKELTKKVCDVVGLKNVTGISIDADFEGNVTLTATMILTQEQLDKIFGKDEG